MDDNRIEFDNPPDLEEENNALRSTIPVGNVLDQILIYLFMETTNPCVNQSSANAAKK